MEKVQKSKQQEPTASALYKLASYFGESSDYLPGLQAYKFGLILGNFGRFFGLCRFRRRVFSFFGKRQAQSVAVLPYEIQRQERKYRNDRRRKEDFERRREACRRRIDVRKPDNKRDQRADNHRKKYVEAHSHALESAFRARGDVVLERRHKRRAQAQNRTQHKDARNVQHGKPRGFRHKLHQIHDKRAGDDNRKQGQIKNVFCRVCQTIRP